MNVLSFYTDTKSVLNFAPSPRNLIQKLSETILPIPDSWNGHCICNYALLEFIDEHLICYAFIPVYVFYFGNGNNKIPGKSHESR